MPEAAGGDLPELDITTPASIEAALAEAQPDVVFHCAAYTDVDGAARDPALAYRINGLGTQNVAIAAAKVGAALVHISTNEVFDGAQNSPYGEFDAANPINPYARSKHAAEWYATHLSPASTSRARPGCPRRAGATSSTASCRQADERGSLRVVTDEIANPTFVDDLAGALLELVATDRYGIYHLTNAGHVSRYDYARKILELSGRGHIPVEPIVLADYPRASTPPPFGALANTAAAALGITLRPWEAALADFLAAG